MKFSPYTQSFQLAPLNRKLIKVLLHLLQANIKSLIAIMAIQLVAYSLSDVAQAQSTPALRQNVKETNPQLRRPSRPTVIAPSKTSKPQPRPAWRQVYARSTYYNANESISDSDTRAKKTSSLVRIDTIQNLGLGVVAVDPSIIPYGSQVITPDGRIYIAADRGGDVITRKAATELATLKGLGEDSAEYRALVLDFYSKSQVGGYWDTFIVIPYTNPDSPEGFRELPYASKIAYLKNVAQSHGRYQGGNSYTANNL